MTPQELKTALAAKTGQRLSPGNMHCPVHEDKRPSLSIFKSRDERFSVNAHCFGCGAGTDEIFDFLGIDRSEKYTSVWKKHVKT